MQQVISPYVTAGVALVGSSIIVVTPVATPLPDLPDIQSAAVQLTAGEDSFPWLTQVGTDLKTLADNFLLAPAVGMQQLIANEAGLNTPEGGTPPTIGDELKTALAAITLSQGSLSDDDFANVVKTVPVHTLDSTHSLLINPSVLNLVTGDPNTTAEILPTLYLLASPLSGVLWGMVSPYLAPIGALQDSITRIFENIQQGDWLHAFEDLVKTPLNMIGSVFTGSELNLDFLTPMLNNSGLLPEGMSITSLDFGFAGLLTPGVVNAGTAGLPDGAANAYTDINGDHIPAVGSSLLNDLGLSIDNNGAPLFDFVAHPAGPIGAMIGLSQAVGAALGMNWDGKNAVAQAPLLGLDPFDASGLKDLFGGGTAAPTDAAVDGLGQALTDLLSGNWDQAFNDIF